MTMTDDSQVVNLLLLFSNCCVQLEKSKKSVLGTRVRVRGPVRNPTMDFAGFPNRFCISLDYPGQIFDHMKTVTVIYKILPWSWWKCFDHMKI